MKLYEINAAIQAIDDEGWVNEETGEIDEVLEKHLDSLVLERKDKIESICLLIKDKDAFSKAIKEEEAALRKRREQLDRKAEWLRGYLAHCMLEREEFRTAKCEVRWRKSERVEIEFDMDVPDQYVKVKQTAVIDKAGIKKALKAGEEVTGAKLVTVQNIQVK